MDDHIMNIISTRADGLRHEYTINHQCRVALLARRIGERMALSPEQVEDVMIAGLIHDVGKNNIPINLLDKPEKLIDHEWTVFKMHPADGYGMLENDIKLSPNAKEVALRHHERMDGTGYPDKLTGDNISILTRIVTVADVVDAIAIHRPYKKTYEGIDKALNKIEKNRGIKFDPIVVDVCLELFSLGLFDFDTNTVGAFVQ